MESLQPPSTHLNTTVQLNYVRREISIPLDITLRALSLSLQTLFDIPRALAVSVGWDVNRGRASDYLSLTEENIGDALLRMKSGSGADMLFAYPEDGQADPEEEEREDDDSTSDGSDGERSSEKKMWRTDGTIMWETMRPWERGMDVV